MKLRSVRWKRIIHSSYGSPRTRTRDPSQRPVGPQPSTEASLQFSALRVDLGAVCAISVRRVNLVGLSGSVGFRSHTMEGGHIPSQKSQCVSLEIRSHALDEIWNSGPSLERVLGRL